jgi:hypothetical protein
MQKTEELQKKDYTCNTQKSELTKGTDTHKIRDKQCYL